MILLLIQGAYGRIVPRL